MNNIVPPGKHANGPSRMQPSATGYILSRTIERINVITKNIKKAKGLYLKRLIFLLGLYIK